MDYLSWDKIKSVAPNARIQIEGKSQNKNFGSGIARIRTTVQDFDKILHTGNFYLTTQYADDESSRDDEEDERDRALKVMGRLVKEEGLAR